MARMPAIRATHPFRVEPEIAPANVGFMRGGPRYPTTTL
jgi:hypothetical protein